MCAVLLAGLLYAGLHPFHAPANQVEWITGTNGLHFGEYATAFDSGTFPPPVQEVQRSIEFWVQPALREASSTLLAFYSPANPRLLSISQSESDLEIHIEGSSAWQRVKPELFYVDNAFRDRKSHFWTVTFGDSGTSVYRDGIFIRRSRLVPSARDLAGQLVAGNSPIFSNSWSGTMRGLAIYDVTLSPGQINRHYSSWTKERAPRLVPQDSCIALYLFNEHQGDIIHNQVGQGNDLYIPGRFIVLRKSVLDPVWRAFDWHWGFWEDAFINVAGFIPFGCFLCAWFCSLGNRAPRTAAVVIGAAVSLTIELSQVFLPTRDSSMADLINNTVGSALGAAAYRGAVAQAVDGAMWRIARLAGWTV